MHVAMSPALEAWASFYVIVGSSAGALTGLQFVVMTLIASSPSVGRREDTLSAFGTPNVVHFCAALLVAAILSAPWSALAPAGVGVSLCGLLGTGYSVIVLRRAQRQRGYQPVLEDWVWHTILPFLAYAALLVAGALLAADPGGPLFVVGASTLLLVFIGIHNAWDTVTYVTMSAARTPANASAAGSTASSPTATAAPGRPPDEGA